MPCVRWKNGIQRSARKALAKLKQSGIASCGRPAEDELSRAGLHQVRFSSSRLRRRGTPPASNSRISAILEKAKAWYPVEGMGPKEIGFHERFRQPHRRNST